MTFEELKRNIAADRYSNAANIYYIPERGYIVLDNVLKWSESRIYVDTVAGMRERIALEPDSQYLVVHGWKQTGVGWIYSDSEHVLSYDEAVAFQRLWDEGV